MKILITGGLGFIGSEIAKYYCNENHDVVIITRSKKKINNIEPYYKQKKIKVIVDDINCINSYINLIDYDIVFHCASTTHNYHIHNNPYLDVETNIIKTITLLEDCKKHNPKIKIVYLSTFFVNGNPDKTPVNSDSCERPLGLYGATKLCAEHICQIYGRVFDLDISIARITNAYGLNEQRYSKKKGTINRLIWELIQGETIKVYNDSPIRDFIYIDDIISGLVTIADKGEKNKVYYLSNENFKFSTVINMAKNEIGYGKIEYIESPEFHKQVGVKDFICDNSELKKLGWNPKISVYEGVKRVVDYYRILICNNNAE